VLLVTLNRKALVDFTFSDGTVIPAGTTVATAALPVHHDEVGPRFVLFSGMILTLCVIKDNYEDASRFDPLRFYDIREKEGRTVRHQMMTPEPGYVAFGMGKHAWYVLLFPVLVH